MEERKKPFPIPDINSAPFWKAAQEHKLKLPKCQECGHIAFPPRPSCPRCFGAMEWTEMSGRATVFSYSIMHDTFIRGFDPPFLTAQVELEDQAGLRLYCNIWDCEIKDVYNGMPVEVTFEDVNDEVGLPQFRPRSS
jgi:uncharacterized OB-fold protein